MKYLKRTLFVVAALITLVALFYAIENWRGARDYQAVIDRLRDAGEELDFAKLTPSVVPDDENFGSAPFLQDLKQEGEEGSSQAMMQSIYDSIRRVEEAETTEEFLAIAKQLAEENGSEEEPLEFLVRNLEPWQPIRQTLVDRLSLPHARWNKTFPSGQRADAYAVFNIGSFFVMKMTAIQARVHLLEGQEEAALEDIFLGLRLGKMYRQEPALIPHVLFLANLALMGEPIKDGLRTQAFSSEQLDRLGAKLGEIDFSSILQTAMRGERGFALTFKDSKAEILKDENEASWLRWVPRGWALRGFGVLAEACQETVEIFEESGSTLEAQQQAWETLWEECGAFRPTKWTASMGAMKLTGIGGAHSDAVRVMAVHQAVIEINKFKLLQGRYPAGLDELPSKHLDPFDEQPLVYQRLGDGFRIETREEPEGFPYRLEVP